MQYLVVLMIVCMCVSTLRAEEWTPPMNPNLQAILQEAQQDTAAKRYSLALEKFVWFHEHAREINPAMSGVRLSFALMYWHQLADVYPPALQKLEEFRDQAQKQALIDANPFASFHDLSAINRELKSEGRTVEVFEALLEQSPEKARIVFHIAEPAIVRAKKYGLCNQFIGADSANSILEIWTHSQTPKMQAIAGDFSRKKFIADAASLVALLAVNGRQEEADQVAEKFRPVLDDAAFHKQLDEALKGTVPAPWP